MAREDLPNPANEMGSGAMICPKCKEQNHNSCPGGTWCNCQHKVKTYINTLELPSDDVTPDPEKVKEHQAWLKKMRLPAASPAITGIIAMANADPDGRPVRRARKATPRRPKP